jgi:hypothetical protein
MSIGMPGVLPKNQSGCYESLEPDPEMADVKTTAEQVRRFWASGMSR